MLNVAGRDVASRSERAMQLPGIRIMPLMTAAESDGTMSILEYRVEPGAGTQRQVVRRYTMSAYIVAGCFEFQLDDELRQVGASGFVTIAGGTEHSFRNVGVTTGILVLTTMPGGYEEYLRDFAELARDEYIDLLMVRQLCDEYGVEILGP